MADSLFNSSLLTSLLGSRGMGALAGRLGEPESSIQKGLESVTSTLFGGLLNKANDTDAMKRTLDLASSVPSDITSNFGSLLDGSNSTLTSLAGRFLPMLFGGGENRIAEVLSGVSGLKSGSITSLLATAAPLILGFLGKRVKENGLSANGLASLLNSEAPSIQRMLPAGIASLLKGAAPATERPAYERRDVNPVVAQAVVEEKKPASLWLWLLPLALIVAGLLWYFTRDHAPAQTPAAPVTAEQTPAPTTPATTPAAPSLGDFVKKQLPDNVELNIPSNGLESKLLAFLQDPSKKPDTTSWIDFDRLLFDTGSTSLQPQSEEQLKNIAAILKAYPRVHVKVGGYTDSTGDPQQNVKLSQGRADSVVAQLVQLGVQPARLQAKGYGEQYPIGDNSTEEGRAKNRRISMLVTRK
jgi:OmpA-OmpF porin, OOP family